jgi:uncharacterized protein (DUF1684 family)
MYDGRDSFTYSSIKDFMSGLKICTALAFGIISGQVHSQKSYSDSLQSYINNYVKEHEVVRGDDKKYFRFFPIDKNYRVVADFEKPTDNKWFSLETSGREKKTYRVYGILSFTIHDTLMKLNLYQSQNLLTDPKYKDYLVLMFTDKTSGDETYEAGRYLDFILADIKNNKVIIDFNKAYNPYCAYVKNKHNCPLPPRENHLPIAIRAGEKTYGKKSN